MPATLLPALSRHLLPRAAAAVEQTTPRGGGGGDGRRQATGKHFATCHLQRTTYLPPYAAFLPLASCSAFSLRHHRRCLPTTTYHAGEQFYMATTNGKVSLPNLPACLPRHAPLPTTTHKTPPRLLTCGGGKVSEEGRHVTFLSDTATWRVGAAAPLLLISSIVADVVVGLGTFPSNNTCKQWWAGRRRRR